MRILVFGPNGMLGRALCGEITGRGHELIPAHENGKDIDITKEDQVARFVDGAAPDLAINAAAYTDVDGCETNEDTARLINATAAGILAGVCAKRAVRFYYISSDYIFDGKKDGPYTEEDEPNPVSAYGRTKLEGERLVLESGERVASIRSEWLFGPGKRTFVDIIIDAAKANPELKVVTDQVGQPTFTKHLARAIIRLGEKKFEGIINVASKGTATRFEYAARIVEAAGLAGKTKLVEATSDEMPRPARRPENSVLSLDKYNELTGTSMPRWEEGVEAYVKSLPKT